MGFQGEYLRILLLIKSGGIETNPGPKKKTVLLKFFHWDLNEPAARDFNKLPLIKVYRATNKFDIVCLSETFPYSSMSNDYNRINIRYLLMRAGRR